MTRRGGKRRSTRCLQDVLSTVCLYGTSHHTVGAVTIFCLRIVHTWEAHSFQEPVDKESPGMDRVTLLGIVAGTLLARSSQRFVFAGRIVRRSFFEENCTRFAHQNYRPWPNHADTPTSSYCMKLLSSCFHGHDGLYRRDLQDRGGSSPGSGLLRTVT